MVLNPCIFFNSAVFQVMFEKWFYIKILNNLEKPTNFQRPCLEKIAIHFVFHGFTELTCTQTFWNCRKTVGILDWGLLHVITRSIDEMMFETRFTKLHSQKKRNAAFHFLKGWIFVNSHVLRFLSIAREPGTILEQGFLHIVTKSIGKMKYTTKFICLQSSPKDMETWTWTPVTLNFCLMI